MAVTYNRGEGEAPGRDSGTGVRRGQDVRFEEAQRSDGAAQARPESEIARRRARLPGRRPEPAPEQSCMEAQCGTAYGVLALGVLVGWREVSSDGSPRVVLMFDVETADGVSLRGIADEDLTITELTRLAHGQTLPVLYRPAVMDHYVALARDADPAHVQQLSDEIASRRRT
jgi:hypothetical protein